MRTLYYLSQIIIFLHCISILLACPPCCGSGYYKDYSEPDSYYCCKLCPAGYSCQWCDDGPPKQCLKGFYSAPGQWECKLCQKNSYCANGIIKPCPIGAYSESGNVECNFDYDFSKIQEGYLLDQEKNLTETNKEILSNLRKYLTSLNYDMKILDFSISMKEILYGDLASTIGTSLSAGQISFHALDKIKDKYVDDINTALIKYMPDIDRKQLIESLSKTKAFSVASGLFEKVGFYCGIIIPVAEKQLEDFKKNLNWKKHVSDLISEGVIAYATIEASSAAGAMIGSAFFGGGAIPGAVAGFTIGVGITLFSDKIITFDGKTPADFIRNGFDSLFQVGDGTKNSIHKYLK